MQAVAVLDSAFVDTALAGAWKRDSHLHGEGHWRCVASSGLWLAAHTLPSKQLTGKGLDIKPSDNIEMLRAP